MRTAVRKFAESADSLSGDAPSRAGRPTITPVARAHVRAWGLWASGSDAGWRPHARYEQKIAQLRIGELMNENAMRRRIEQLHTTGRSAGAIAEILASEGFGKGASRASVGRILTKLRGPVRSPRVSQAAHTRRPTQPGSPPVADAPVSQPEPQSLVVRILADWCCSQPDPQAAYELVLADLGVSP